MIRTALFPAALVAAFSTAAVADEPPAKPAVQDCLITRNIQQSEIGIDDHYYARLRDGSWWKNSMMCPALAPRRALVHSSPIGSQCRGDIVQVVDFTMGGVNFGGCGLGNWERVAGLPAKPPKKTAKKGD